MRTAAKQLRRKLGDDANHPTYILNEPRIGYRMEKGETREQGSRSGERGGKTTTGTIGSKCLGQDIRELGAQQSIMNVEVQAIIDQMEPLLTRLRCCDPLTWDNLRSLPQQGVYVFYENDKPIYAGRSRRIRQRIREHGGESSRHESATFAFKLFREALGEPEGHSSKYTRRQLQDQYPEEYASQRQRVRSMRIRAVEINDPLVQTVFEIYAIIALDTTHYNKFHTT